jgi:hypothetical protein
MNHQKVLIRGGMFFALAKALAVIGGKGDLWDGDRKRGALALERR